MNPLLLVDSYKIHHTKMYPDGMTKLYSNFTPRKSRIKGIDNVVVFGIQNFVLEYLIKKFNRQFFIFTLEEKNEAKKHLTKEGLISLEKTFNVHKKSVIDEYKRHCNVDTKHIEDLWDLGYLPIEIKALDEGTLCPIGVPMLTITNTHPDFGWLVNYLETLLSCMLWQPITSATIAYEYKKILNKYAIETTGTTEGVQWQGHDFSMRGMSSVESAIISGMGHLTSFTGTDTIPAIYQLEKSYNATGLIGASVPATEHSVMCMGTKESEIETFKRLLDLYPTEILSVVSDTWDLWKVCTEYLPQLKKEILARDGKLVIRPDSGDPVDIICGTDIRFSIENKTSLEETRNEILSVRKRENLKPEMLPSHKGVIELLWDVFGGTINKQGYKVLDPHIGAIYGDSITLERATEICERLKAKGFASTNIVFGVGSFTYQYNTRDTFGFAMKATYGEITHQYCNTCEKPEDFNETMLVKNCGHIFCEGQTKNFQCSVYENKTVIEPREIFKDPITDDGTKKSKKGLLYVAYDDKSNSITCYDQATKEEENHDSNLLTTVFKDSKLVKKTTLDEIRNRLNNQL
jgi:nicotinamide phosphoribosyltransferase